MTADLSEAAASGPVAQIGLATASPARGSTRELARLFAHYEMDEVLAPGGEYLLLERALEDGDATDLRFVFDRLGEAEVAAFVSTAARRLSARSLAFWSVVLGIPVTSPPSSDAQALWLQVS